jgi:S-adenosylmethionine hydrolase
MIVLCTDFGLSGPYTGQVKAVLARLAPAVPAVDLFANLPAFEPRLAAYLLAAYGDWFEAGDVILAVVDPGVGGSRGALVVEADGRYFVGPDKGLFDGAAPRRAGPLLRDHLAAARHVGDLPRPRSVRAGRRAAGAG